MIQLTPKGVRNLMFGFESLWGEPCNSVTTREPEPFAPRRVPLEYATILAQYDPDSTVFKIFTYATHAEVWHIDHWNLSASKRMALIDKCQKQDEQNEARISQERAAYAKFAKVKDQLLVIWPALRLDQASLGQLVRNLLKAPRELTDKFDGLTEIIHE